MTAYTFDDVAYACQYSINVAGRDNKIGAIKNLRLHLGVSLKTAKNLIEYHLSMTSGCERIFECKLNHDRMAEYFAGDDHRMLPYVDGATLGDILTKAIDYSVSEKTVVPMLLVECELDVKVYRPSTLTDLRLLEAALSTYASNVKLTRILPA